MTINFKAPEIKELKPRILVLGVGGAGGNAINKMVESGLQGVEFLSINTDAQDLKLSKANTKIQIGLNLTKGLGAGAKLDIGQAAADESLNEIVNCLQGANMVFITAGMGGGTGTGAAHVIARAAKELNILTVGVTTLPFLYEGPSRMRRAQQGLEELRKHVDTIIVIPNQNLFKIATEQTTFEESFDLSNDVLMHGVQSITDLMVRPGLINLDFADVETVMSSMGKAMMGTGEADGEGRATKAAEMAISNPLIDDYTLQGAKGLLVNITGGPDLKLFEVDEAVNKVRAEVDPEAELIIGAITDPALEGSMRVSIVATALDGQQPEAKSVINMVHRIQSRNTGYSDFTNPNPAQSFNFNSANIQNTVTSGANALKLEEPITDDISNPQDFSSNDNNISNEIPNDQTVSTEEIKNEESIIIDEVNNDVTPSNGLENFNLEEESPNLFNSENNEELNLSEDDNKSEFSSFDTKTEDNDEDELEIPAFLRRQKN
ncbi:MAG: cell division protein FtsZ [Candidatus Pelagibacter sp. TMED275]|nr:MAG: cell division protein FtsZ [Candidatus Pelagibacter sp. TMED275]|tara:strand:- start:21 stop:1493 length:1473 start_codon:yes stop_codon:yes gene_type:complete